MKINKKKTGIFFAALLSSFVLFLSGVMGVKTVKADEEANDAVYPITSEIEPNEEVESEVPSTEEDGTGSLEESGQVHTVWTRVEEWFSTNFLEFISSLDFAGMITCIVMVVFERRGNKRHKQELSDVLTANSSTTAANTASNDKVLEATNALIVKQNEHDEKEEKRDAVNEQTMVYERAILEILVAVYANNKNIPQAVKDMVNLKYVTALKTETGLITDEAEKTEAGS